MAASDSALASGGAAAAGVLVCLGVLAGLMPAPLSALPRWLPLSSSLESWWAGRAALAAATGWSWLDRRRLLMFAACVAAAGALLGVGLTGLEALGVVGAALGWAGVEAAVRLRASAARRELQDAVIEAVRMLRQLLLTGGVGVHQALGVLAAQGPHRLRPCLRRLIAAGAAGETEPAWRRAQEEIGEAAFDLLAAAIVIQRRGGGSLAPLFTELEESVTALHEVIREAEALQVQARSAANMIVALPLVFLLVLSALHSPYLDAYRQPRGELFLLLMLAVMAASHAWMRRWLRLPGDPRLRLADAA
jgi:Flp pilus assembly protein TadB